MATPHRDYWRTVRTAAPTGRDGPRGRPYRRRLLPDSTSSSRTRHDDIFGNLFNTNPPRGGRLKKHFDRMASPLQNHKVLEGSVRSAPATAAAGGRRCAFRLPAGCV